MFFKSFALAAVAGSVAQAFLLPPAVVDADVSLSHLMEDAPPEITERKSIKLDCPHCPVVVPLSKHISEVKLGRANHLDFDFTIDHAPDHDRLLVNGFELYPSADPFRDVLAAPQVLDRRRLKSKHHKRPHAAAIPKLGFSLAIKPTVKALDGRFELVTLDLQVIEVGDVFVNGIPNVEVKLVKDNAAGRLMIARVEITESQNPGQGARCTTVVCKWIALVKARVRAAKKMGCHMGHAAKAHLKGAAAKAHHSLGHHGHGHGHHQMPAPHHEQSSNMAHLLENVSSHILLPILIGIIAGVTVSLIGMIVGTLVVAVWRAIFRGRLSGRSGYNAVPQHLSASDEKSRMMEAMDPPPYLDDDEKEVAPQKTDV